MSRFEISFLDDYTDESLLDEIRRVAVEHSGPSLSTTDFKRLSQRVSVSAIRRRFGSWHDALKKAGLESLYGGRKVSSKMKSQLGKRLSRDDLIAEMKRVYALVGRGFLTVSDFDAHSIASSQAVNRRFGCWADALKSAGIEQSEMANKGWTAEQCFENVAEVWTHYGKSPSFRQMFTAPSQITGDAYVTRWGTWRKALRAFVTWANSESEASTEHSQKSVTAIETAIKPPVIRRAEGDQRQVGPRLRFRVLQRDRFRCVACGRSPATDLSIVALHADHITPVALGGKTVIENLQSLCQDCNLGKGKLPG